MEIKDLAGLSEPLSKLVEVCSKGCGVLYKPREIVNNAKAEAEAKVISAKAEAEVIGILSEAIRENKELMKIGYNNGPLLMDLDEKQIAERVFQRLGYQEMKRQINCEAIIQIAASNLMAESTVSSDPVDEDWSASFFDMAQNVSNKQMQLFWGRILAGEVKRPSTYSLRTLNLLRLISKEEAALFGKYSKFVFVGINEQYYSLAGDVLKKYGIIDSDLHRLGELGLIVLPVVGRKLSMASLIYTCSGYTVCAENCINGPWCDTSYLLITEIGQQIISLFNREKAPIEYISDVKNNLNIGFHTVCHKET